MISAIELKKCVAGAGILGVIVGKLYYKKKPCPIILLQVDKNLEISFYCTILLLYVVVRLQVEGSGKFALNAKEIT